MSRVMFIAQEFPKPSEGFILRDLVWLNHEGYEFNILVDRMGDRELLRRYSLPEEVLVEAAGTSRGAGMVKWNSEPAMPFTVFRHRRFLGRMLKQARDLKFARAHSLFGGLPALAARLIANERDLPFSCSVHAADVYTVRSPYTNLLKKAEFVTACNHSVAGFLQEQLGEDAPEIMEIRHVFEVSGRPVTEPCPGGYIAALGRFVEKKGFDTLLKAVASLPDTRLVLGGAGPLETRLKDAVTVKGPGERVTFAGWIEGGLRGMMEKYGTPGAVVVPSRRASGGDREGIPNVMLEAWEMGLPVVASRSGSIEEVARDGENALLTTPGDEEELAAALGRLYGDPVLADSLGRGGRITLEREFAPGKTVRRLAAALWG